MEVNFSVTAKAKSFLSNLIVSIMMTYHPQIMKTNIQPNSVLNSVSTFWSLDVLVCQCFCLLTFWFVDVLICGCFGL